ncbi:MAG: hypothetical protein K2X27_13525 [Candidatus Obscuribacterales bacterium]|nr:hypothetical protein [Candidatus Obscuribacterales bacterium]
MKALKARKSDKRVEMLMLLACFLCTAIASPPDFIAMAAEESKSSSKHSEIDNADVSASENHESVKSWFAKYDQIRQEAEMEASESKQAKELLNKGIFVLLPGFGRFSAQKLLKAQITRYERAAKEIGSLNAPPETKELQSKYQKFFQESHDLFVESSHIINNPLNPLARFRHLNLEKSLKKRKEELSMLELECKDIDHKLRLQYQITAYKSRSCKRLSSIKDEAKPL